MWTGRTEGDQRPLAGPGAAAPPMVPAGLRVRVPAQVHGTGVLVVDRPAPPGAAAWAPGPGGSAPEGDAVVGAGTGFVLGVLTADCAPVALGSPEGVHGALHVGWRGLVGGVVARAVAVVRDLGASEVVAGLGPCIHACCYEFGPGDLDAVAARCDGEVRAHSARGRPALDLPAAVRAALGGAGVAVVWDEDRCTACGPAAFSHRARADVARQALLVWSEG